MLHDAIEVAASGPFRDSGDGWPAHRQRPDPGARRRAGRPAADDAARDRPAGAVRRDLQSARARGAARGVSRGRRDGECVRAGRRGRARQHPAHRRPCRRTAARDSRSRRSSASWASRVQAPTRLHSVPPGPHGGNIDINLLTAGSSLYLPVQVRRRARLRRRPALRAGRRRGVADRDGGVAAGGCPVRGHPAGRRRARCSASSPDRSAETTEFLVPTGMDADLDVAVRDVRARGDRAAAGALRHGLRRTPTRISAPRPTSTSRRSSTS